MSNDEVLTPKALIIPIVTPAASQPDAPIGSLVISGAKLYVKTTTAVTGWQLVTSA